MDIYIYIYINGNLWKYMEIYRNYGNILFRKDFRFRKDLRFRKD